MAVAVAPVRGFARSGTDRLDNSWVGLVPGCLRILLPMAPRERGGARRPGVVQNLTAGTDVTARRSPPDGHRRAGRVAEGDQGARHHGGGCYNANSVHPFENPGALSNLLEVSSCC